MDPEATSRSGLAVMAALPEDREFRAAYQILELLGRGSFGVVMRALHLPTGREVAIKLLSEVHDEDARGRFLREARVLAGMRHPAVVRIYDVGTVGRLPYMALELLPGGDLELWMRSAGRVAVPDALRLMIPVAGALGHFHALGITHRDVKPANILLDADGSAKLSDFGLVLSRAEVERLTATGMSVGTPRYMAPEAVVGDEAGPPADVYALGVVLYELLAGASLFAEVRPHDVLMAHVYHAPPPLASRCPGVHPALARLVHRCLDKLPANRPQHGAALEAELAALSTALSGSFAAPGFAGVSGPMAIPAGFVPVGSDRAASGPTGSSARHEAPRGPAVALLAALALAGLLALSWRGSGGTAAQAARSGPHGPAFTARLRAEPRSGWLVEPNATAFARSPDGHLLASAGPLHATVSLWDLDRTTSRSLQLGAAPCLALAFSPDGQRLAAVDANGRFHGVKLVEANVSPLALVGRQAPTAAAVTWSRPEGPLAVVLRGGDLELVTADAPPRVLTHGVVAAPPVQLSFDPPGERVDLADSAGLRVTVQIATGQRQTFAARGRVKPLTRPSAGGLVTHGPAAGAIERVWFSAGGKWLKWKVRGQREDSLDLRPSAAGRTAEPPSSPPRTAVARKVTGPLGPSWLVDVQPAGPGGLEPPFEPVALVVADPPGYVAVGGPAGQLAIAPLTSPRGAGLLGWSGWSGHRAAITALAATPDGATLASGAADGTLRIWTVEAR